MSISAHPCTTVTFEDGSIAVIKTDPRKPRLLEAIAIFFNAAHARDYAERENSRSSAEPAITWSRKGTIAPASRATCRNRELSPRQSAVLAALHAKMDEHKQAAAKAVDLAEAAQIPLGSLHSVLDR